MKKANLTILLLLFAVTIITASAQSGTKTEVNSTDVSELLKKNKNLVILDVRTAEEFNEGHIKGAINIDVRQLDFAAKVEKLNKNAKYLVHCRTNHRSTMAVNQMMQSGFKTIYQMMDGFAGWSANGLPIQK